MNKLSKESAAKQVIDAEAAGQRIDNYLMRQMKGVPKSHVYRILRSGEVRVNSGRIGPDYRLQSGDQVRIPPVRIARKDSDNGTSKTAFRPIVLFEDAALLVINKPAGMAVHGGSGISLGIVEGLRNAGPEGRFLELVHRLDRGTSGVLMLAKKRSALVDLHRQLQAGAVEKRYLALVKGQWRERKRVVDLPLEKYLSAAGERRVNVEPGGDAAVTIFRLERGAGPYSLLDAELKTGRTHQIRVHLAHLGFPILGDDKYGDFTLNKLLVKQGLKRIFLHARRAAITHPLTGKTMVFEAPLPADLATFMEQAAGKRKNAETI